MYRIFHNRKLPALITIRLMCAVILGVLLLSIGGYANALVVHPEDNSIVGLVDGAKVCFNNDGELANISECDNSGVDEGLAGIESSNWFGGALSGINVCVGLAVNPVSSATCVPIFGNFAACQANQYVLLQTTRSDHYFAVKANASCTAIATPESIGVVPCLATDAFDSIEGCVPGNPPVISVDEGFFQLDTNTAPPGSHCADRSHQGRMVVDSQNGLLYICTQAGWTKITPDE